MNPNHETITQKEHRHSSPHKTTRHLLVGVLIFIALFTVFTLFAFAQGTTAYESGGLLAICGVKFHDLNGNGHQDPGEPGLEGWTIIVEGAEFGTEAITGPDGRYCVQEIQPGDYIVFELLQDGWMQTYPPSGEHHVVIEEQSVDGVDFGNWQEHGGIHGQKWLDINGDGVWDEEEPGLSGWEVQLTHEDGTVYTTTTEEDGRYWFINVPGGIYTLTELLQPGWQQTYPPGGYYFFELDPEQTIDGLDFGNVPDPSNEGSIHGTKWHDQNGNGVWDNGEPTLSGWTIWLEGNGFVMETETDGNGEFWFMGLPPGEYALWELLESGWVLTFPDEGLHLVQLGAGQTITGINFGNWDPPATGSIHGRKFHDQDGDGQPGTGEPGLEGWTILLSQGNQIISETTTNENGEYWFMGLLPGEYMVSEVISGQNGPHWNGSTMEQWTQTFPENGVHIVDLAVGETIEGLDFGNWQDGKNDFCMIPWDNHFLNEDFLDTQIFIFNTSNTPEKGYDVQMFGPTTFSILTPLPITLNPFEFGVVDVRVDYPPIFTGPYQNTTFGAIVTNLETGTSFTCSAALWSYSPDWWTSPNVHSGLAGGIPPGFTQGISFTVQHNGPMGMNALNLTGSELFGGGGGGANASYTIYAMSRGMTDTIVSLNGLPPGDPLTGDLSIAFGENVDIPVNVSYTEMNLLAPTDIVFELDVTGDGIPDMVTSYLAIGDPYRIHLPIVIKD